MTPNLQLDGWQKPSIPPRSLLFHQDRWCLCPPHPPPAVFPKTLNAIAQPSSLQHRGKNTEKLFHEAVEEALMEVIPDGVVDEPLLRLGLPPRLVLEDHIVVPPPLHLCHRQASSSYCVYFSLYTALLYS